MAKTPNTGLITSDPITSLEQASKVNLIGGGVLLVAAGWLAYKKFDDEWDIPLSWFTMLVIGAILLAVLGAVLRLFDGYFRYKLTGKVIERLSFSKQNANQVFEHLEGPVLQYMTVLGVVPQQELPQDPGAPRG